MANPPRRSEVVPDTWIALRLAEAPRSFTLKREAVSGREGCELGIGFFGGFRPVSPVVTIWGRKAWLISPKGGVARGWQQPPLQALSSGSVSDNQLGTVSGRGVLAGVVAQVVVAAIVVVIQREIEADLGPADFVDRR